MTQETTTTHYSRDLETPFGFLRVSVSDEGVTAVRFGGGGRDADGDHPLLDEIASWLSRYAENPRALMALPLAPKGTPFEHSVWDALGTIPAGETRSYADIAKQIDRPNASRAVGRANGANPIAILIPCHRVVASDGTLHGYAGGLDLKRRLLDHEGAGATLFRS